jgi:hypothetical protein
LVEGKQNNLCGSCVQPRSVTVRPWISVPVLLACAGSTAAAGSTREDIERDLRLDLSLSTPETIETGQRVGVKLRLRNRSRSRTHLVVAPGDGSEVGWREPHLFFTAEIEDAAGNWRPVDPGGYGRCGLYDFEWEKSITALKPRETLDLGPWIPAPNVMLDLGLPGRVRLRAHYAYRAGAANKGGSVTTPPPAMTGVPSFEIVSRPVEIRIERPVDLVITVSKPLPRATRTPLADILDLELHNVSTRDDAVAGLGAPDAALFFEVQGPQSHAPELTIPGSNGRLTLSPGERASLLGDAFGTAVDASWEYPVAGTVRLRATYVMYRRGEIVRTVRSGWASVTVH